MTTDEELRRAHDVVCACPADDSDPDCNWRPTITEIRAALAARSEPPPAGLDVERLAEAVRDTMGDIGDPAAVARALVSAYEGRESMKGIKGRVTDRRTDMRLRENRAALAPEQPE